MIGRTPGGATRVQFPASISHGITSILLIEFRENLSCRLSTASGVVNCVFLQSNLLDGVSIGFSPALTSSYPCVGT